MWTPFRDAPPKATALRAGLGKLQRAGDQRRRRLEPAPSQTLLDLFTIHETQGKLDGLTLAFVGDLKYGRTVHSLAQALALFNCKFYFIAPEALAMPDYICEQLDAHGIEYQLAASIEEVVPSWIFCT